MKPIALSMLCACACACATPGGGAGAAPEAGPASLAVPVGNSEKLSVRGSGVQIYLCRDAAWTLEAPDAQLTDEFGAPAGKHYAGPTWEAADGSRVVGEVAQKQPSADSIPWLLLKAKSNAGSGLFANVAWIQRLDTAGGKAPPGACETGIRKRVDYSATYRFFGR